LGESILSAEVSVLTAPAQVLNLRVSGGFAENVLNWDAVLGADTYTVYWNQIGGGVSATDSSLTSVTSATQVHTNLTPGRTYYYSVVANNASASSSFSAEVSAVTAPAIPSGMMAVLGNGFISINWAAQSGVESYKVYWKTTPNVSIADNVLVGDTTTQVLHSGVNVGTRYYYRVSATNISGESLSEEFSILYDVPIAPQSVQATATDNQISLVWPTLTVASGYTIYWNTSGNVTKMDAAIDAGNQLSFTHTALQLGTIYYYAISARNPVGEGPLSAPVSAATAPTTPQNLRVDSGLGAPIMRWDNIPGATDYVVYWNTSGNVTIADTPLNTVTDNNTEFTSGVDGVTYHFAVLARNSAGISNLSTSQSVSHISPRIINPVNGDKGLFDIAWSGSRYVAVGGDYILSSANGDVWVEYNGSMAADVFSIIWGNNEFLAVGTRSTMLSSDGINWSIHTNTLSYELKDVVWTGSQYLAVGGLGLVASSSDGITWTQLRSDIGDSLLGLAWSGNLYVAVSSGGYITSPDGITWSTLKTITKFFTIDDLIWAGDRFVISGSGGIAVSTNATTWTIQSLDYSVYALVWTGSNIVAMGYRGVTYVSSDGIAAWVNNIDPTNAGIGAAVWDGTQIVALSGAAIVKGDGSSWTLVNAFVAGSYMHAGIWTGTQYVTVGNDASVFTSPDGINWSRQSDGSAPYSIESIVWNGSIYVIGSSNGRIYTSTNTLNWTLQPALPAMTGKVRSILWDGSQFIAVGGPYNSGYIVSSPDGVTWTEIPVTDFNGLALTGPLTDIVWSGNLYVAVGGENFNGSILMTSPDALTWTAQDVSALLPQKEGLFTVAWSGSGFVAGGYVGASLHSRDGITWQDQTAARYGNHFYDIKWVGDKFVAAGARGGLAVSIDGQRWYKRTMNSNTYFTNISSNGSNISFSGYGGVFGLY